MTCMHGYLHIEFLSSIFVLCFKSLIPETLDRNQTCIYYGTVVKERVDYKRV